MTFGERRDSYRLPALDLPVFLEETAGVARLLDLSGSGGMIALASGAREWHDSGVMTLRPGDDVSLATGFDSVRRIEGATESLLGFRFSGMQKGGMVALSRLLMDRYRRVSARKPHHHKLDEIALHARRMTSVRDMLLGLALRRGRPVSVFLHEEKLPVVLRPRMLTVEAARQVIVTEVIEGCSSILNVGDELTFAFPGPNCINVFESSVWRVDPSGVQILVPELIRQLGFRSSFRFRPEPELSPRIRFDHPRLTGESIHRRVLDVSSHGVSFRFDPESDALFPGELLRDISLDLPSGCVRCDAVIRSVLPDPEVDGMAVGLELSRIDDPASAHRWYGWVMGVGYPGLKLGRPHLVESAWEVLRSSGYLDLVEGRESRRLESRFHTRWKEQTREGSVSRFLMSYRGGKPVATAATSILYPRTWMPHHFGIDEKERASKTTLFETAREVYLGTMYVLETFTECEYFVFYFDAGKRWHEMLFMEFLDRVSSGDDHVLDRFSLYKSNPAGPGTASSEVVIDDPLHIEYLAEFLCSTRTALEVDALSLSAREFALHEFSEKCLAHGYERQRHVAFGTAHGDPVAALVMETGDEAVNVFNLLNRAWFVVLQPEVSCLARVLENLVRCADGFYALAGKRSYLLMGPEEGLTAEVLDDGALRHVAQGVRWLASRKLIPAYLDFVHEVMSS